MSGYCPARPTLAVFASDAPEGERENARPLRFPLGGAPFGRVARRSRREPRPSYRSRQRDAGFEETRGSPRRERGERDDELHADVPAVRAVTTAPTLVLRSAPLVRGDGYCWFEPGTDHPEPTSGQGELECPETTTQTSPRSLARRSRSFVPANASSIESQVRSKSMSTSACLPNGRPFPVLTRWSGRMAGPSWTRTPRPS